ncbi:MAG: hypothetical protein ACKESB_01210 [Candidatus Hodgkinia cicadicola]
MVARLDRRLRSLIHSRVDEGLELSGTHVAKFSTVKLCQIGERG